MQMDFTSWKGAYNQMYFLFTGKWAYNWRETLKWGGGWWYKGLFWFIVFFSVLQNLTKLLEKGFEFY